jgi:hypothetical protein
MWDEYWSYISSKRNSIIAFENLILPCGSVSGLSLIEKDDFDSDDYSNTINLDCDMIGVQE